MLREGVGEGSDFKPAGQMDRTKKIYQPILKPVKPGESRERVKGMGGGGTISYEMARFDFAKKFAQLIQDEERGTEGGASPRGSSVKPSVRAVEGREEAREAEADPESTGTSSTLREAVSDSLQSMRKADLTKGPASSNLVSLEEADIQTESSVISEAEDLMALMREGEEEREEAGERRIQEGSPHNHSNGERHKPNTKRPDSVASLPRHPPCARHVLDQGIVPVGKELVPVRLSLSSDCRV